MFAHAGGSADRTQSHPRRQRPDRRHRQRLRRLQRHHSQVVRHDGRSAQGLRIQHRRRWGKWHNTPEEQITSKGPFDYWPTGYGFEYFYGFLAGEASQYEPTMVRNTTYVERPETSGGNDHYHLSEDIADDAIHWLREQKAYAPDKPWFMYWAPGASHGPHQVMKEWADKYQGKFDDGWDEYRERVFANQKRLGWIPADAKLTPRAATMASWESIPENEKPFQRRLMEVFAGFTEHADAQAGRIIDEIEDQGELDNTLVLYIWGDNGSSSEGLYGTISEQLAQNGIPTKISEHLAALEELGGLDALGTAKTDNMYHAGWAWAGSTPYQGTKLQGAYFGGTRQPMAVSWPKSIQSRQDAPSAVPPRERRRADHLRDAGDPRPAVVNGFHQDEFDGVSMAYTLRRSRRPRARATTQFFDIMASRGIYHDGWFASARGPREPWVGGIPQRDPRVVAPDGQVGTLPPRRGLDPGERFGRTRMPEKLEELKALFLTESAKNKNLPIGGGLWSTALYHPEDAPASPLTEWTFDHPITGMPESAAPKLGKVSSLVTMEVDVPEAGQRRAVRPGRLLRRLDLLHQGQHPVLRVQSIRNPAHQDSLEETSACRQGDDRGRVEAGRQDRRADGRHPPSQREGGRQGRVPAGMSLHFTSNATFDIGADRDSPVSLDYYDQAPFTFNGTIGKTEIKYSRNE